MLAGVAEAAYVTGPRAFKGPRALGWKKYLKI
jgi:hypothetical protein